MAYNTLTTGTFNYLTLKTFFALKGDQDWNAFPFILNMAYLHPEIFSFMMSLPAMSLGDRLCVSRKGGTGGGGRWVHPKGDNA